MCNRDHPVVSVVIVNFNAGRLLSECVHSVLLSTVSVQVFVCDNGSTDGSLPLLRNRLGADPRLHIIENGQNLGFTRASNIALKEAMGEFVLLLNPDCIIKQHTIARTLEAMAAYPEAGMAGCLVCNPDGTEQAGCRRAVPTPWRTVVRVLHLNKLFPHRPRFRSFVLSQEPLPKQPVFQEAISGAFMLVRLQALEQVGPLDEGYFLHCDDLDWCMRFRRAGWQILFVPDIEVTHYKGACSHNRPIFASWHKHKGMVRFYRKFFRHQYPMPLMWAVVSSVWVRFSILAIGYWIRRIVKGKSTDTLPVSVQSAPAIDVRLPGAGNEGRRGASVHSFDPSRSSARGSVPSNTKKRVTRGPIAKP